MQLRFTGGRRRAAGWLLAGIILLLLAACAAESTAPAVVDTPAPTATSAAGVAVTLPSSPSPTPAPSPTAARGGRDGSLAALVVLPALAEIPDDLPEYDRGDWRHWLDADRDCQNTRHEALAAESAAAVSFATPEGCRVAAGRWHDPYTGLTITDPSMLDIDHLVPLYNAHRSGGWRWDAQRKADYANDLQDPAHLIAVRNRENRQKGADGPEDWRPPNTAYWCQYAVSWAGVKVRWGLTATARELQALREMLATCDGGGAAPASSASGSTPPTPGNTPIPSAPAVPAATAIAPTAIPIPAATRIPTPAATRIPAATPIPAATALRPTAEPDRDCSDFTEWQEAQAFFEAQGGPEYDPHRLDRDGDGIACKSLQAAPVPTATPKPTAARMPTPAATPTPSVTATRPTAEPDRNCSDFAEWPEAQAFFEAQGGPESDPHGLDRDGDGIACKSLPGGP